MDKRIFKKSAEELQLYLHFRKRGSRVNNKKAKAHTREARKRAKTSIINGPVV